MLWPVHWCIVQAEKCRFGYFVPRPSCQAVPNNRLEVLMLSRTPGKITVLENAHEQEGDVHVVRRSMVMVDFLFAYPVVDETAK